MTARERLFACLEGKATDRVPVWLLFPYHPSHYYVDVRNYPDYKPIFDASKKYALMLNRRNLGIPSDARLLSVRKNSIPLFTPEVSYRSEVFEQDGAKILREHIVYRGRSIFEEQHMCESGSRIKKPINSDSDLEFFCSLPVETDERRIRRELETRLPEYQKEKQEFPKKYGSMMLDLGEPIIPLYAGANLEEYSLWSITQKELVKDFLDRNMQRLRIIYKWSLENDLADIYFLVGTELASPPLVSRETFRNWIVDYDKELIDMIHSYGKKVIQHYHGQIREVLSEFSYMGADAIHTIEAPPIGNCTLTQAYKELGDNVTLIGNIQYDDFRSFSKNQMAAAINSVLDECRGRRFILSPTAGPFLEPLPRQMIENYITFMETAWNYPRQQ
ncbi:uroporphyrinogen decarboxylase family protein [Limihaloglobus sulfuriphilus]|nr:uroporphyrinogen decarboxylase family protein [Limihaloglobus sulfuriphilus]